MSLRQALYAEKLKLEKQLRIINVAMRELGQDSKPASSPDAETKPVKRHISAAGRKRISEAAKRMHLRRKAAANLKKKKPGS